MDTCGTCQWWNPVRYDDWGCCENLRLSHAGMKNFTTPMGVSFGCILHSPRAPVAESATTTPSGGEERETGWFPNP